MFRVAILFTLACSAVATDRALTAANPCETDAPTTPPPPTTVTTTPSETVTTTPAETVTTTPAGPGPCDPTTTPVTTTVTTTPAATVTTTPGETVTTTPTEAPTPCQTVTVTTVTTTPAETVTTTPMETFTTTPAPTTTPVPSPCTTLAPSVKLYSDSAKEQTAVQAKTAANTSAVVAASALPSWLLPICGVFALAAGVTALGMRRRRAARSTRTIQVQGGELPLSDASDEEPFLFSDFAEV